MRRAFKVCALCAALSVFSGANCGKGKTVENADAGARPGKTEAADGKRTETPNAPAEKPDDPFAKIPRMSVGELRKALDEGRAVAADVRPAEAFEEEHIEGALSVPEDDWAARAGELPKGKLVVTYCA